MGRVGQEQTTEQVNIGKSDWEELRDRIRRAGGETERRYVKPKPFEFLFI